MERELEDTTHFLEFNESLDTDFLEDQPGPGRDTAEPVQHESQSNTVKKDPNPLENSRPLDVHRWSESPQLVALTKSLAEELFVGVRGKGYNKRKRHLRMLLADLFDCYRGDPTMYIGYSRSKSRHVEPSRYNKLFIKYRPLVATVDALSDAGLIEDERGFKDRVSGKGRNSRMRASAKLTSIFDELDIPPEQEMERVEDLEVIELRNENKQRVDYVDDDSTNRMREVVQAYNERLANTYIDLELAGYREEIRIDLRNKLVRRIFNNSRWDHGGRFHGGWWQNVPREIRPRIVIDGERTTEIDYRGLHIVFAYALEGVNYFLDVGEDPYSIRGLEFQDDVIYRRLFKESLLCCLNAKSRAEAVKAIQMKVNFEPGAYPDDADIGRTISALESQHRTIAAHFYSGIGLWFQWLDSKIAEAVIANSLHRNIPVLCVHDSFVCREVDGEFLEGFLPVALPEILRLNGIRPVTAELKCTPFYRDGPVVKDLGEVVDVESPPTVDLRQYMRWTAWNETGVQQALLYSRPSWY